MRTALVIEIVLDSMLALIAWVALRQLFIWRTTGSIDTVQAIGAIVALHKSSVSCLRCVECHVLHSNVRHVMWCIPESGCSPESKS